MWKFFFEKSDNAFPGYLQTFRASILEPLFVSNVIDDSNAICDLLVIHSAKERAIPAIHKINALRGVLRQRMGRFLLKSIITLCSGYQLPSSGFMYSIMYIHCFSTTIEFLCIIIIILYWLDTLQCGNSDTSSSSWKRAITPNYPSNYPDSYSNYWYISAPSGYKTLISFTVFSTESCCDKITIGKNRFTSLNFKYFLYVTRLYLLT